VGTLKYGNDEYEFEDRLLAHLKLVIAAKLLRHESFLLNWTLPVDQGPGRVSLWITRESQLTFRFDGNRPPPINPRWLDALMANAGRTGGMLIVNEEDIASPHPTG
jgi:hypothetical protein